MVGRITVSVVDEEISRLRTSWSSKDAKASSVDLSEILPAEELARIDPFDLAQLAEVVRVCRTSRSLSDAGRKLFTVSRQSKAVPNDADRLRKYLARFKLDWQSLQTSNYESP